MPQPATRKRSSSTAKSKRSQSAAKTPSETRVKKAGRAASSGGGGSARSGRGPARGKRAGSANGNGGGSRALELFSPTAGHGTMSKLARKMAKRAVKKVGESARERTGDVIRSVAQRAVEEGRELAGQVAGQGIGPRLPIQRSIDIAVPLGVAWEEWMALEFLPEGVDRVHDIERDGDELTGSVGRRGASWRADIIDERERQSFAWQSTEGSDCAGLITFHRLSERLTRLELNLDVVPASAADLVALSTHLAHRRAELDLRQFKARLELINPDLYEDEDEPAAGAEPDETDDTDDTDETDEPAETDQPDDDGDTVADNDPDETED